ncbi:MAG: hypothetical protein J5507_03330 [Clostridia bacterium]|nr:hypothetical protein [Clostridia bacterium]
MKQKTRYQESFDNLYSKIDIIKESIIILIIVLFLDYFNIFTKLIQFKELIPIYFVILLFIIVKIIEFEPWNLYKLKTVNYADSFLTSTIISLSMYIILNINSIKNYKVIISSLLIIFFYILEIIRIIKINKIPNKEIKNNVYDLKDLYDGNILNDEGLVFIKESDVDYDLLDRGSIINGIINVISNCYTSEKFVIGLEGSWGSGKTTIINNLKKYLNNQEIIIIDNFDPWSYEDEKSLFRGMFDIFMKSIKINFSIRNIDKIIDIYMDTIFNNSRYEKQYNVFKKHYANNDGTNKIRKIINNYLKQNNKRILFIIDNIERAEKENIIFLFKLINNILNFENTIYFLSFDDEIMRKIFNENLNKDYNYLKKIIQLEIKIPEIDKYVMKDICSKCINNLLKLYEIPQIENKDINQISDSILDLRELKRYLNSIITYQYKTNNYLNCVDVFLLEIIKKENYKLYKNIERYKKFFVSEDIHLDNNIYTLDVKGFNVEGKKLFDDILKNEDEKYKNILSRLFPYVKRYLEQKPLRDENYYIDKDVHTDSIINKKIANARYFNLYFCQNRNEFTAINEVVDKFITILNNFDDTENIEKQYITMVSLYNNWIQKFTLELLEMNLQKVNIEKKYVLLNLVYKNYSLYDDSILFAELSALSRSLVIISDLVIEVTEEELNKFIKLLEKDNFNLYIIHELIYWIENNKGVLENKEEILNKFKYLSKNKINVIINNKINILDDKNYYEKNIWGFYHATKENEELRKKYIKSVLNENTIFRFLNDMISRSMGNKYGYKIVDENINAFTSRDEINNILNKITRELTDDEKMLLKVYNKENLEEGTLYLDYDKRFKV